MDDVPSPAVAGKWRQLPSRAAQIPHSRFAPWACILAMLSCTHLLGASGFVIEECAPQHSPTVLRATSPPEDVLHLRSIAPPGPGVAECWVLVVANELVDGHLPVPLLQLKGWQPDMTNFTVAAWAGSSVLAPELDVSVFNEGNGTEVRTAEVLATTPTVLLRFTLQHSRGLPSLGVACVAGPVAPWPAPQNLAKNKPADWQILWSLRLGRAASQVAVSWSASERVAKMRSLGNCVSSDVFAKARVTPRLIIQNRGLREHSATLQMLFAYSESEHLSDTEDERSSAFRVWEGFSGFMAKFLSASGCFSGHHLHVGLRGFEDFNALPQNLQPDAWQDVSWEIQPLPNVALEFLKGSQGSIPTQSAPHSVWALVSLRVIAETSSMVVMPSSELASAIFRMEPFNDAWYNIGPVHGVNFVLGEVWLNNGTAPFDGTFFLYLTEQSLESVPAQAQVKAGSDSAFLTALWRVKPVNALDQLAVGTSTLNVSLSAFGPHPTPSPAAVAPKEQTYQQPLSPILGVVLGVLGGGLIAAGSVFLVWKALPALRRCGAPSEPVQGQTAQPRRRGGVLAGLRRRMQPGRTRRRTNSSPLHTSSCELGAVCLKPGRVASLAEFRAAWSQYSNVDSFGGYLQDGILRGARDQGDSSAGDAAVDSPTRPLPQEASPDAEWFELLGEELRALGLAPVEGGTTVRPALLVSLHGGFNADGDLHCAEVRVVRATQHLNVLIKAPAAESARWLGALVAARLGGLLQNTGIQ